MGDRIRTLQIGKGGINENLLNEIGSQLGKHKILRIRILRSARKEEDSKVIARGVSERVKAKLVNVRGNTFVLEKR